MIRAGGVETIESKIDSFADAHTGVAKQQEEIAAEVITAAQFLLERLIVLCREGARQAAGSAWNILTAEQLAQVGVLCGPS
jgi:hypothetical protein